MSSRVGRENQQDRATPLMGNETRRTFQRVEREGGWNVQWVTQPARRRDLGFFCVSAVDIQDREFPFIWVNGTGNQEAVRRVQRGHHSKGMKRPKTLFPGYCSEKKCFLRAFRDTIQTSLVAVILTCVLSQKTLCLQPDESRGAAIRE